MEEDIERVPSSLNGGGFTQRLPSSRNGGVGEDIDCISTQRAPSTRNGGGYRRDARPPPEMKEGGKTIDCTLPRRAPSSQNGGVLQDARRYICIWEVVGRVRAIILPWNILCLPFRESSHFQLTTLFEMVLSFRLNQDS
jgi:hypothetical protein